MQTAIDATIQIFVISTMLALGLQVPPKRIAFSPAAPLLEAMSA